MGTYYKGQRYGSSTTVTSYNPFEYITNQSNGQTLAGYAFRGVTFSKDTVMRFRNLTDTRTYFLFGATVTGTLTIKFDNPPTILTQLFYGILQNGNSKIIIDADLSRVTSYSGMLRNVQIKEIETPIDFTSATIIEFMTYAIDQNAEIVLKFVPNTLKVSMTGWTNQQGSGKPYAKSTQISIANALNEETSDKSIQGGVVFNRNTIFGNSVLDETETYHIFVEDENGEMTLSDFITNVKGWTLS